LRFLYAFNKFIEKWMPLVTPSCLIIGILLADYLGGLSACVTWLFAFMTFTGSLSSGFRDMKQVVLKPLPLLICLLLLHVWLPLLACGAGNLLFPAHPYLIAGIVLEFVVPTGIVSLIWVNIYRGNSALTLSIILIDTLLAPFLVPLSMKVLVGSNVQMSVWGMMKDLLFMIAIPALLAMTCNQVTKGEVKTTLAPKLAPFSKICLILVVTINSTKVAPFVKHMNGILIAVTVTILVLAASGYVWGILAARLLKQDEKTLVSLMFNSGMRNISAGAVIAAAFFPGEVMFPVMIGTLFQQVLAGTYAHFLPRFQRKKAAMEEANSQ
jgi:predicted Na+-dependent transporter